VNSLSHILSRLGKFGLGIQLNKNARFRSEKRGKNVVTEPCSEKLSLTQRFSVFKPVLDTEQDTAPPVQEFTLSLGPGRQVHSQDASRNGGLWSRTPGLKSHSYNGTNNIYLATFLVSSMARWDKQRGHKCEKVFVRDKANCKYFH
jgi:hypothetical protein